MSSPVQQALLDLDEGWLALRCNAHKRAMPMAERVAERLAALSRPQYAGQAQLLLAEAALACDAAGRATIALNRMADLILPQGCIGYLLIAMPMCRRMAEQIHLLRGLRRDTRALLERLIAHPDNAEPVADGEPRPGTTRRTRTLSVSPFGQGAIRLDNRPLPADCLSRKVHEVLQYAVRNGRLATRDDLLRAIWDESAQGEQKLWNASRHIRRVLGADAWMIQKGVYRLELDVEDAQCAFEQAAAQALSAPSRELQLEVAMRALDLSGAEGYLEWCESRWAATERRRMRTLAVKVALHAGATYGAMGLHEQAAAVLRRAVDLDPYHEEAHAALAQALLHAGRTTDAQRVRARYRRLMHDNHAHGAPSPRI